MCAQAYLEQRDLSVPVEVETRTLDEVREVVGLLDARPPARIQRVMLDNMAKPDAACEGELLSTFPCHLLQFEMPTQS